jgi:hypothetical protein
MTDQVFSEEVLSKLSETVATAVRMQRMAGGNLNPDMISNLERIKDSADRLATYLTEVIPDEDVLTTARENGQADELVILDSSIIEGLGSVNQALSMMDLEGAAGISPDELDSVCDMLDALSDSLRHRALLIAG